MLKKIIGVIFTIIGLISGYIVSGLISEIAALQEISFLSNSIGIISLRIFITVLFGIIYFILYLHVYIALF